MTIETREGFFTSTDRSNSFDPHGDVSSIGLNIKCRRIIDVFFAILDDFLQLFLSFFICEN